MKKLISKILCFATVVSGTFLSNSALAKDAVSEKSSEKVKVSVVVPIYNVEEYLKECLDSISGQTLKDIEIICVNDGSKDGSLKVLKECAAKDERIKVIDKKNEGVSVARNTGIEKAMGEYVAFVDSDDIIDPTTYEVSYKKAVENNADILCFGWRNFPTEMSSRKDYSPKEKVYTDWFKAKRKRESINCWNKLYKRSILIDNKIRFNKDIKYAEDECFNLCVYPLAKKMVSISDVFYNYRVRKTGATFSSTKNKLKNYIKVWKYVKKVWKGYGISICEYLRLLSYPIIYKDEIIPFIESCIG